jgi:hypothetical protein
MRLAWLSSVAAGIRARRRSAVRRAPRPPHPTTFTRVEAVHAAVCGCQPLAKVTPAGCLAPDVHDSFRDGFPRFALIGPDLHSGERSKGSLGQRWLSTVERLEQQHLVLDVGRQEREVEYSGQLGDRHTTTTRKLRLAGGSTGFEVGHHPVRQREQRCDLDATSRVSQGRSRVGAPRG